MDPLSDILRTMSANRAIPLRFESSGRYAMRFGAYEHVKFGAVLFGQFNLWVDGEVAPIHLQAGDCYLLTDGRPCRTYNAQDVEEIDGTAFFNAHRDAAGVVRLGDGPPDKVVIGGRFTFDRDGAVWLRDALPPIIHIRSGAAEAASLRLTLGLLGGEAGASAPGAAVMVDRLADILLVQAIRVHLAAAPQATVNWLAGVADSKIGRALRDLHADVAAEWSVATLAKSAGMSRSAFAERFRAIVGMAPFEYLTRWCMVRIKRELLDTDQPFAIIAQRNGYQSRTSCSQAFRRVHGYSPAELRQTRAA